MSEVGIDGEGISPDKSAVSTSEQGKTNVAVKSSESPVSIRQAEVEALRVDEASLKKTRSEINQVAKSSADAPTGRTLGEDTRLAGEQVEKYQKRVDERAAREAEKQATGTPTDKYTPSEIPDHLKSDRPVLEFFGALGALHFLGDIFKSRK